MNDKPKVSAHLDKPVIEIDGKTGDVTTTRAGVLKGFGQGFKDYVAKGPKNAVADIEVNTGQYPEGHPKAGAWVVQVMIAPFEEEVDAATVADRVASVLTEELRRMK